MAYSIIQPPFTLNFQEMPKKQLEAYGTWFHEIMAERVAELSRAVKSTAGFERWEPNMSVESLDILGEWFAGQVETRRKTRDETEESKVKLPFPVEISEEELTNRTLSLAMDIAMYFGQVVRQNLPDTQWDQPLKNKKFADYGQPVLMGFGTVPLNPVRIIVTAAYGIARKQQSGSRLRDLYNTWATMKKQ